MIATATPVFDSVPDPELEVEPEARLDAKLDRPARLQSPQAIPGVGFHRRGRPGPDRRERRGAIVERFADVHVPKSIQCGRLHKRRLSDQPLAQIQLGIVEL